MNINTRESQAENLIADILYNVRDEWQNDDTDQSFDEWLYDNLGKLGESAYDAIGGYIGGEIE